jgi:hypothetical protein
VVREAGVTVLEAEAVVAAMVVEVAEAVMVVEEVTATMNVAAAVVEVTVVVEAAAMVEEVVVTETAAAAAVVPAVETGETVTTLLTECVHAQVVKASCCSRMGIVYQPCMSPISTRRERDVGGDLPWLGLEGCVPLSCCWLRVTHWRGM